MLVRSTLKWSVILASLLAIGPVAGVLVGSLRGPGGAEATTPLLSIPLGVGLANTAAAIGLAAAAGLFAARFFGSRTGMTCAGLVLAWAAWSTGSLDAILAPARGPGEARAALLRMAVEGAALGAVSLVIAAGIVRVGAATDARITLERDKAKPTTSDRPDAGAMGIAALAAICLGGLVTWWVAFQPLKGQVLFGSMLGAIAAAAIAHLAAPHLPARASAIAAFAAMAILAALGPVSALVFGPAPTARAAAAGATSHLAFLTGLDWAAGAFLGVPIGLGWSGSMVEKHTAAGPAGAGGHARA